MKRLRLMQTSVLRAAAWWILGWLNWNAPAADAPASPTTNAVPAASVSKALAPHASVIVVVGAAGEPEFGTNFTHQATTWSRVCEKAGARRVTIGLDPAGEPDDLTRFRAALTQESTEPKAELWIVLIGHGTFDGRDARFNLRGPDFSATELAEWLKPIQRPVVLINTASASAPFINKISGTNRIVVSATRSGFEQNATRFGRYFAEAITDPLGDLDQDGQTSVLEAFLRSAQQVEEHFKNDGRLASEHALIDDNGDGQGTPADWFRGTRATRQARQGASVDGTRARQRHLLLSAEEQALTPEIRARRDALELEVESWRAKKASLPEDDYYAKLEPLFLELARLRTNTVAAPAKPADGFQ